MLRNTVVCLFLLFANLNLALSQTTHSIAHEWLEATLQAIREDRARPPIQARNLFHTSIAMYDAWAAFDDEAETYFLGKTVSGYTCNFSGIPAPADIQIARETAISYAAYRLLSHRFAGSFNAPITLERFDELMVELGYDPAFTSTDYSTGNPAALGNYLGQQLIAYGIQDGANEQNDYVNQFYLPANPPLIVQYPGNPDIIDPNRWQPLTLNVFIDQNGNILGSTPAFQSPEWGLVIPFAMTGEDRIEYERDGHPYWVYHDPGPPPLWDAAGVMSDEYKWNFSLVSTWSSHLTSADTELWDISPGGIGNNQSYPQTFEEYQEFYDLFGGGDSSPGHDINPYTGEPYEPQLVKRGDYARVLAEFWADGPNSETPPGHWYSILNYVNDHPALEKRFNGKGPLLDDLEWDVKSYFTLGGAVHDAAITAWGIKGWYDYVRPVSAIRYMAGLGQSSDPGQASYHPGGISLYDGFIELVEMGDPLAGFFNENVGKIKLKAWRGPNYIFDPGTEEAGVDWILAESWMPYQRPTFVTPPFAGYISGHSTYSRAAAEALTLITGDAYFPGGMGVFEAPADEFLVFEDGPSQHITLQWATYRDASDQCSLSRIWGGIHPPCDDIPGRLIGAEVGTDAFELARAYFYRDDDNDGYFSYEDCDDGDPGIHPGTEEICDGRDNDCNGLVDDGLPIYTYYRDADGDGFGNIGIPLDTCLMTSPLGFVAIDGDCDDGEPGINPAAEEICDGIDNDCDGGIDDGLTVFIYYRDADGDGFGNAGILLDTCLTVPPTGFVANAGDCNDGAPGINPAAEEICDGIDNDCNGGVDDGLTVFTYYRDADGDGFGNAATTLDTCLAMPPLGFVANDGDCNDEAPAINPAAGEVCDGIDNDCNGGVDDGLALITYYRDADVDGFGNAADSVQTCYTTPPAGYVANDADCDDERGSIRPDATDIPDNGIDEDCSGSDLYLLTKIYPNPVRDELTIHFAHEGTKDLLIYNAAGQSFGARQLQFIANVATVSLADLAPGVYILRISGRDGDAVVHKIVKL